MCVRERERKGPEIDLYLYKLQRDLKDISNGSSIAYNPMMMILMKK